MRDFNQDLHNVFQLDLAFFASRFANANAEAICKPNDSVENNKIDTRWPSMQYKCIIERDYLRYWFQDLMLINDTLYDIP